MKKMLLTGCALLAVCVGAQSFAASAQAQAPQPSIVFASNREGGLKIFAASRDGGNVRRITNNTTENKEPAASPNGRYVVFASTQNAQDYEAELVLLNLATQQETVLTANGKVDYRNPAWSPDGTRITFGSIKTEDGYESCINVMTVATKALQEITCRPQLLFNPSWTPNGQELVYTEFYRPTGGKIYTTVAQPGAVQKFVRNGSGAVFSPNGHQLAFEAYDANYMSQIFVADTYSATTRQLTHDSSQHTVTDWAADGYITFNGFNPSQGGLHVSSIRPDGSSLVALPQKGPGMFDIAGKGLVSAN